MAGCRASRSVTRFGHPRRKVTLGMKNAPDVDMIFPLKIENEIRKTRRLAAAQSRQIQLMGVSRRTCRGPCRNQSICSLKRIDEAHGNVRARLFRIMVRSFIDIPPGRCARDHWFASHFAARRRTRSRKLSKYPVSTASIGAEAAPCSKSPRRYWRS